MITIRTDDANAHRKILKNKNETHWEIIGAGPGLLLKLLIRDTKANLIMLPRREITCMSKLRIEQITKAGILIVASKRKRGKPEKYNMVTLRRDMGRYRREGIMRLYNMPRRTYFYLKKKIKDGETHGI